jgi:glycosyltransferase involved in cell wall biosynthesis
VTGASTPRVRAPRVLQVCGVGDGGAAEHVLRLSEGLTARGWEVHVSCPPSWLEGAARGVGLRVHSRRYPRRPAPLTDLAAATGLFRLMRLHEYDIVHLHSSKAGAIGRLAARLAGRHSVYTPHAWAFLMDGHRAARTLWTTIERVGTVLGDAIICVSEAERRTGEGAGVLRRSAVIAVIPNGVAIPIAARTARDGDRLVVGTIARLCRQKGVDVLVDAVPRVVSEVPGTRFVIVGDGPWARRLHEQSARLGVSDAIEFRTDLIGEAGTLLDTFDVFVLPSRWEGMPLALLEACAAGLPCIASDVGGVTEILTDEVTGRVVRPGDPAALAAALVRVLSNRDLRADWGSAAREHVRLALGLERMVDATEQLYLETALAEELRA